MNWKSLYLIMLCGLLGFVVGCNDDDDDGDSSDPEIRVLAPDGGEEWFVGTTHEIRWESEDITGNVRILLSRDGGANWPYTISSSTTNDGSYDWTVSVEVTESAKIRVENIEGDEIVNGNSDNPFMISDWEWTSMANPGISTVNAIDDAGDMLWSANAVGQFASHEPGQDSVWTDAGILLFVNVQDLSFASASDGWAVGANGSVYHTTNAGNSWDPQVSGTTDPIHDVDAVGEDDAWFGGEGYIGRTTDGGVDWNPAHATGDDDRTVWAIDFETQDFGFAAGEEDGYAFISRTDDGGGDWDELLEDDNDYDGVVGVHAYSDSRVIAVSGDGHFFMSSNDGDDWEISQPFEGETVVAMSVPTDDDIFVAVALNTFYMSNDGGNSWTEIALEGGVSPTTIYAHDEMTVFIPLTDGDILRARIDREED